MKKSNLMAGIFMGVAIAASIPLGINRTLVQKREEISYTFYSDQAGYSIYDGIEKRREAASNLITIAERYKDKNPELEGLIDSLDYRIKASEYAWSEDDTFVCEAQANFALDEPAEALAEVLNSVELSENDKKYPDRLIKQMRSEQDKINRSSYNDEARAFNAKAESLSPMALVKLMADFSAPAGGETAAQATERGAVAEDDVTRETAASGTAETIPSPPDVPEVPESTDTDDFEQRVNQWADGFANDVESGVEGLVDGVLDGIFG